MAHLSLTRGAGIRAAIAIKGAKNRELICQLAEASQVISELIAQRDRPIEDTLQSRLNLITPSVVAAMDGDRAKGEKACFRNIASHVKRQGKAIDMMSWAEARFVQKGGYIATDISSVGDDNSPSASVSMPDTVGDKRST